VINRQKGYVKTSFGLLHYWSQGDGPVLLMIHQSAQASDEYLAIAPLLADSFRVVAVDLPGHGASDDPDHELTVDEYTAAVAEVLDELAIDTGHALGHHGGAYIALNLALLHPERVMKTVFSGAGTLPQEQIDAILNMPMSRDLPLDDAGEFLHKTWAVYRKMTAPGIGVDVTFQPFLVALDARTRPYDMHYSVLRWDSKEALSRHKHPTLLLKGEADDYSGDVRAVHDMLADSRFESITGGGAWLFYEQPEGCAEVIRRFLLG